MSMNDNRISRMCIECVWRDPAKPIFVILFQQGFKIKTVVGISVKEFLLGFGVDANYIDKSINTIFLDGMSVDDLNQSIVDDGSILTLSSSMPGFVGAALRKGGFYSGMRKEITHKSCPSQVKTGEGYVTVKLFNFVAGDIGPIFLERGIDLRSKDFMEFINGRSIGFMDFLMDLKLDGHTRPPRDLPTILAGASDIITLKCNFE